MLQFCLPVPPWPFVDKRCCSCSSPWSSVALRGQKVLQLQFSVSLRGPSWTKGVAVAVLRVPPRPFVDKRCCSCSSPWSSVALRGQKVLQLQFSVSLRGPSFSVVLRGPSWTKGVAVAVLRVPPWPFVDKKCCSCSSPCPSVALRGQKVLQLQFSVVLRGPSWTKGVAVAVLRVPPWPFVDKRCCSRRSPCPSASLRGQKVLQLQFSVSLRVPSWTKGVAVLQFSVSLRGPSWTKGVAVAVLRVPPCGSSWTKGVAVLRVPPWPFVDKRCCCSSLCGSSQFSAVCPSVSLRGQKCCSCSSPWSSVALRGQKVLQLQFSVSLRGLRGQKVLQLQFSVSLRGSKNRSSCPIVYISG